MVANDQLGAQIMKLTAKDLIATAEAEYKRATAPALAEYRRTIAKAWFEGWRKDHATV